jgi:DNA-directed RNA polymerase subunit RPC12/RpoP
MDISFNCDKCGQQIVIDEAGAGLQVECPKCGNSLQVANRSVGRKHGDPGTERRNQAEVQRLHDWIDDIEKAIDELGGLGVAGISFKSMVTSLAPLYWKAENALYGSIIQTFSNSMKGVLVEFAKGDDRATRIDLLLQKWKQIVDSRSVTQADYFDFVDDSRALAQGNPHFLKPEIDNFDSPFDVVARIEAVFGRDALERRLAQIRSRIFVPHKQPNLQVE